MNDGCVYFLWLIEKYMSYIYMRMEKKFKLYLRRNIELIKNS